MGKARLSQSYPIEFREWFVSVSAGMTLAFSAWALGGVTTSTMHSLLFGGIITLFFALVPFPKSFRSPFATLHFPRKSYFRLFKWPPFYFSLAFLLFLLIGALNPAIEQVYGEDGWWIEAVEAPYGINLPTSVRSDYEPMNAWRALSSLTAAFTLIWGIWAGITRRKAVLFVLWSFLLSGAAMSFVGILQFLTGAEAVLWTFPSSNQHFWGSFFYRNHGVAFLNLVLVVAGVLFFYHARKTNEIGRSSGPHFLCFLLFSLAVTSVGLALSRGGILFATILSLVFLCLLGIHMLRDIGQVGSISAIVIPLLLLVLGAYSLLQYVDLDAIEKRFGDVRASIENIDKEARMLSSKATWDMAQDRLLLGWGAGSFRYIFPIYQKNYPEIFYTHNHKNKGWVGRKMYRYAHNDLVQYVAEYGLIGSGLLLLAITWIVISAFRLPSFSALFLLVGFACSMCHAFIEFIFSSPAYWLAFTGIIAACAKLLQMEAKRRISA
ncbi:MAG: O-antigen ligase family protein [Verrucomicrobiota bacterium]|nr:O-antigen ligase family protein [Verrucomicrobiota bacterium]MEC8332787.1 O-antigen ligase family protein [Verrucomicrobiota bacterium]